MSKNYYAMFYNGTERSDIDSVLDSLQYIKDNKTDDNIVDFVDSFAYSDNIVAVIVKDRTEVYEEFDDTPCYLVDVGEVVLNKDDSRDEWIEAIEEYVERYLM